MVEIIKFTKNTPLLFTSITDGFRISLEYKKFNNQRQDIINFLCDNFGEGYMTMDTKSATYIQNKNIWGLCIHEHKYWNRITIILDTIDKLRLLCTKFNINLNKIKIKELEEDKSLMKLFKNIENEFIRVVKYNIKKNFHNPYDIVINYIKNRFNIPSKDIKLINYQESIAIYIYYYGKNYTFTF